MAAIFVETRIKESTNIFQHDSARPNLFDKTDGLRKEVSFILLTKLLPRNRERRARNASSQQINTTIWMPIKIVDISTNDIPLRTVLLQYLAIIFFILYKRDMDKACHCKP